MELQQQVLRFDISKIPEFSCFLSILESSREIIDISSDEEEVDHSCLNRSLKKETDSASIVSKENYLDDDCVILDDDPDKSLRRFESQSENGGSDELLMVAEKGQVACRDYPHARHLCARFPFDTTPHQKYCDMCHCYVCDTHAPCVYWDSRNSLNDHCHSTEKEEIWRLLRECSKQGTVEEVEQLFASRGFFSIVSRAEHIHPQPSTFNDDSGVLSTENLDRRMVQGDRLAGIVKWFSRARGFGFITPESGEEELFVHQSSIKSEGYRSLDEGEEVEFEVGSGEDGKKMAINVTGPGGSFGRGATIRTVRPSVISVGSSRYNRREVGHFASVSEHSEVLSTENFDRRMVQGDRLTGIVKWFSTDRGFGFITPDSGVGELFVHQSTINAEGRRSLTEGEEVEFEVRSGEDGRKMAINVTGPGGSFVRGTTIRTVRPSVTSVNTFCYNCGKLGHFARDCPQTESTSSNNDLGGTDITKTSYQFHETSSQFQDNDERETVPMVNAERLTGIVKWFNNQRGIGYIAPNNGGENLFVKRSSIKSNGYRTLMEGEEVVYQIGRGDDGRKMAINVGKVIECSICSRAGHSARICPQRKCHKCGQLGHLERECTEKICHRCDKMGHWGWECPELECYKCNEHGHLARDCTVKMCNKCNENGHLARECMVKICHRCDERGHLGWECPQLVCYKCDEHGHLSRDCTLKVCHRCDEKGHLARECTVQICYRCKEKGHLGRECPKLVCHTCGEHGHLAGDCTVQVCNRCNAKGHLGSECPQIVCCRCNEHGHLVKDCSQELCHKCLERGLLECFHHNCYNCGERGHLARECPIAQGEFVYACGIEIV